MPLTRVALHGHEKYLISALPVSSFLSVRLRAFDTPSKESGKPQYAAFTEVQYHCSAGTLYPICLKLKRSNTALCATFTQSGSSKASSNSSGISSP